MAGPPSSSQAAGGRGPWLLIGGGIAGVAVLGVGAWLALGLLGGDPPAPPPPPPIVTPPPVVQPPVVVTPPPVDTPPVTATTTPVEPVQPPEPPPVVVTPPEPPPVVVTPSAPPAVVTPSAPPVVVTPSAPPTGQRAVDVRRLVDKGRQYLEEGDPASASRYLELAAQMGDAGAAFAAAELFDPLVLQDGWQDMGHRPDPQRARDLYQRAAALGDGRAAARLAALDAWIARGGR